MNKDNEKIYFLAMTELLINFNNKTDLIDYSLEYTKDFMEVGGDEMVDGCACLAVAVRLRNNITGAIEWGNIYCKKLKENCKPIRKENIDHLQSKVYEILSMSDEEKAAFISRTESRIITKPYLKSNLISPKLSVFFENLNSTYDYPSVSLGGKIPKEARPLINIAYDELVTKQGFDKYTRRVR